MKRRRQGNADDSRSTTRKKKSTDRAKRLKGTPPSSPSASPTRTKLRLTALAPELLALICSHVEDDRCLLRLESVCWSLSRLCASDAVWHPRYVTRWKG